MSAGPRTLISVLRGSHDQLAALVRPLGLEQLRAQSYDTDWTIAQVLSHIGSGAEISTLRLAAALAGGSQPDQGSFPAIWDAWDNRTPEAQAADGVAWDEEYVRRLEQLTDAELASISVDMFAWHLDAAGLVQFRLAEQAVHVWDVAVSIDPGATLRPDAVPFLFGQATEMLRFIAKPAGDSFRVRLRTIDPAGDYLLTVAEAAALSGWAPGTEVDGEIQLPAEALLRLFYGRLDPAHTPACTAEGIDLDRLRKVFPGF